MGIPDGNLYWQRKRQPDPAGLRLVGVTVDPAGSEPSADADILDGGGGPDILNGGGGDDVYFVDHVNDITEEKVNLGAGGLDLVNASVDYALHVQLESCAAISAASSRWRAIIRARAAFANEILQGAPRVKPMLEGDMKELVDEKAEVIKGWMRDGKIARTDPWHLIFSIWATTQHYADFDVQVRAVLGPDRGSEGRFEDAARFLEQLFLDGLRPRANS